MIKLAFRNLFRQKTRTFLAILGIIIGITALIALNAVIDGIYNELNTAVGSFQGIMVMQKGAVDQPLSKLKESLKTKISSVQGVRTVVPEVWGSPRTIDGKAQNLLSMQSVILIYGVDASAYRKLRGSGWIGELEEGELLDGSDHGYVLLGKTLAKDKKKFIGSTIKINDEKFKVKGILKTESELYGNVIMMNISDARKIAGLSEDKVNSFYVELENPKDDKKIAEKINFLLGSEVEAMSSSDFSETFANVLSNFSLTALAIAAISAFVAAMGIMNTILMNIMERYKEIGTLKATGWTNFNIMQLILYESFFMGLIGGVCGVVLGILASFSITAISGVPTLLKLESIAQAFLFAFSIGIVAGLYPAYRASRLEPAEAIRSA